MRLEIARCPHCSEAPVWIFEWLATRYEIRQGTDGSFDYTGAYDDGTFETKLDRDRLGRVEVACAYGHFWRTRLIRKAKRRLAAAR